MDILIGILGFSALSACTLIPFFLVRRRLADWIVRNPFLLVFYMTTLPVKLIAAMMLVNYYKEKNEERKLYLSDEELAK